jgi:hypothetical protein
MEIRHGRMTREEGIEMVKRYDAREPSSLDCYCDFLGITKRKFYELVVPMRDSAIWGPGGTLDARPLDSVDRHAIGEPEERARPKASPDRALAPQNRHLYYNPALPPLPSGDPALDQRPAAFKVL